MPDPFAAGALIDLSPPVGRGSPVWPGDTPYATDVHWPRTPNSPVQVQRLTTSPHIGAHADAPAHFRSGGATATELPLDRYLGPCQVIHCLSSGPRQLVGLPEVRAAVDAAGPTVAPRLLIRAYAQHPGGWDDDFPGVDPAVMAWLAGQGGVLIGVDTASLDPMTSLSMAAHRATEAAGLAILENLMLGDVPEGRYELIALPLRLVGLDASPVRAVLRRLEGSPR